MEPYTGVFTYEGSETIIRIRSRVVNAVPIHRHHWLHKVAWQSDAATVADSIELRSTPCRRRYSG